MKKTFRPEVQGLRAIAVLAVLLFHIWPEWLRGGYVGVDVFFVISGYLITGHLLREVETTGRIGFADFYARRIRRLLPAATAVLLAVAGLLTFLPVLQWGMTGEQIAASALYYQNWWLAFQAVDYMGAENVPGPLQHFWSLAIEEQYYILWPLLLGGLAWGLRSARIPPRRLFEGLILLVFVASLAYCIYLTPRNQGWAYFATTTRAWELALGGLLASGYAFLTRLSTRVIGTLVALAGLAITVASMVMLTRESMFPGYLALFPVVGAGLILVGTDGPTGNPVRRLLATGPLQYFGDISYSLYLWHWPVVVYARNILGVEEFGLAEGGAIVGISIALAHFSKTMIEDRWRAPSAQGRSNVRAFAMGALCILLSLLSVFWTFRCYLEKASVPTAEGVAQISMSEEEGGGEKFTPRVVDAVRDTGKAYALGCITTTVGLEVKMCDLVANPRGKRVVVVGDSHAVAWLPALEILAEQRGWNLVAVVKSACPFAVFPDNVKSNLTIDTMISCADWERQAVEFVRGMDPDILVATNSVSSMNSVVNSSPGTRVSDGIVDAWNAALRPTAPIIAIADTPRFKNKVPDCVSMNMNNYAKCGRTRTDAVANHDPIREAAAAHPRAHLIDLTDEICTPTRCEPIVNGYFAWRDAHHMTATFARSLAPRLGEEIDRALATP